MEYKTKVKKYPQYGDRKRKMRFAFFPVKIKNNDFIWAERYYKIEEYTMNGISKVDLSITYHDGWIRIGTSRYKTPDDIKFFHWYRG